jgi:hypothetical protein
MADVRPEVGHYGNTYKGFTFNICTYNIYKFNIEAPERYLTRVGSGLTCKHLTRLERLARDKNFNFS